MTRVWGTFAGSGDAFGSGGRLQGCVHLRSDTGAQMLLDCGATALVGLKRHGIEPNDVGTIVLSHLHGDHFAGVPYVLLDGQFRRREQPLDLVGPPGTEQRVLQTMELLFPGSTSVQRRFTLRVHEVGPGEQLKLDGCTVRTYPAQHQAGAPALSLRLEFNDRVVAYSGDTAWNETLIEVARGAAVFICEGYTLLRPVPFHLHLPLLREHLGELTCERLILTHPSPEVLAHARNLEFELADDNTTFEI